MRTLKWMTISQLAILPVLVGCEEEKPAQQQTEPTAAVSALEPAPAAPEPEPVLPPEPKRPRDIDIELTDERRAAIEKGISEAKGFLVAAEIEDQLKKDKGIKEESSAVKAFDKAANGRWLLFTGPIVNLTDNGFDMAISYTPLIPGDAVGLSRQFFTVTFSDIGGYDKGKFKAGDKAVVLAKYEGDKAAKGGHELVEAGHWQ